MSQVDIFRPTYRRMTHMSWIPARNATKPLLTASPSSMARPSCTCC